MSLEGKQIAILIAPRGTEDPEFAKPKAAVEKAGGAVTVISLAGTDKAQTNNMDLDSGSSYKVDAAIADVTPGSFDALVIPGGTVGADKLRASPEVVAFARAMVAAGKPVAAICHGPWVLIEAGAVDGRTVTSFPSLRTDLLNASATWVDQEVAVDGNLITSRNPHDLPAFCDALVHAVAGGVSAPQPALA